MDTSADHLYTVNGLRIEIGAPDEARRRLAAERLECSPDDLIELEVLKRSIDARGRGAPVFDERVRVGLPDALPHLPKGVTVWTPTVLEPMPMARAGLDRESVVIVGAGPCGLFAALGLAERGIRATILERGRPVGPRAKDVSRLMGKGLVDDDSNLCYGEGGAGTFSDGKLYSRIARREIDRVIHKMVEMGAPRDILIERRPHLGTDRLIRLLRGIREHLTAMGTEFRFETRVERLEPGGSTARACTLVLADGERLDADHVVLAPGHSARRLYRHLATLKVALEPKVFSTGFRIEHPQALINEIQYGRYAHTLPVPAADYSATFRAGDGDDRTDVYSFCMCPGGSVVPTGTREGEVCVNGMSHSARSGHYANSAVVVQLKQRDVADGKDPLFAGVRFQERIEARAWELGGGAFRAPAARLLDYLEGQASAEVRRTTYKRGVIPVDLDRCYPEAINDQLRAGMRHFDKRLRGFASEEAVLIGVETRTSAPLRILRDDSLRSPTHPFLYPGGEGAGYAGGIASAAADGLRIARRILTAKSS